MTSQPADPGPASTDAVMGAASSTMGVLPPDLQELCRRGEASDVARLLAERPELARHRSAVLELAYQEFRRRRSAGQQIEPQEFADRFPGFRSSLCRLIEVHQFFEQDPTLLEALEGLAWPAPGQQFLGFALVAELGRGAFGRVFLASEPALGDRPVAVKISADCGQEAEILGKLTHPNIVPVYSVRTDEAAGLSAICMPYQGLATLGDLLDVGFAGPGPPKHARVVLDVARQGLDDAALAAASPPARVLRRGSYVDGVVHLGAQIAEAMAYAHGKGVLHRDLKPSNVLLTPDGSPVLVDFNLSFDEKLAARRVGGTLPYMAPEDLRKVVCEDGLEPAPVDARSDLFGLGVILYELLCGRPPFGPIAWRGPVEQVAERLLKAQAAGPRPLAEANHDVGRPLARVVERCLAIDPQKRPRSADQLAVALRRQLGPRARVRRWAGRHRLLAASLVTGLLILLAALGVFFATRPPYDVRMLRRGMERSEAGRYQEAIDYFGRAIDYNPASTEAVFARGRAYEKAGSYRQALFDFEVVPFDKRPPEVLACAAHCLAETRYCVEGIAISEEAIKRGFITPGLLNNLGYCLRQRSRFDEAEKYLNQAISMPEAPRQVYWNLMMVCIGNQMAGQPLSPAAISVVEEVEKDLPDAREMHQFTGYLYSIAAQRDARYIRPALDHLKRAVAQGYKLKQESAAPTFSALRSEREFQQLLDTPPGDNPSVPIDWLVDPL